MGLDTHYQHKIICENGKQQEVTLGWTRSGRPGLFTKNMLACSLEIDQATPEKAKIVAERLGFKYVESDPSPWDDVDTYGPSA